MFEIGRPSTSWPRVPQRRWYHPPDNISGEDFAYNSDKSASSVPSFSPLLYRNSDSLALDPKSPTSASPLARPPVRRWITRRDLADAQRDQIVPLIGIAANLRTVPAPHIPFEFMDGCRLRSADDVQGDCLMRVAAKAFHFAIEVASIETSPRAGGRLSRALEAEHAFVPGLAWRAYQRLCALQRACSAAARMAAP